jgi:hypothetical protein
MTLTARKIPRNRHIFFSAYFHMAGDETERSAWRYISKILRESDAAQEETDPKIASQGKDNSDRRRVVCFSFEFLNRQKSLLLNSEMANSDMRVTTPEILWHGGGLLPGKPDPVLSIDMYQEDILVTAGIDANIPPKGSIRVGFIEFLFSLEELVLESWIQ